MTQDIKPASEEPLVVDTAALMASISKNNRRARVWGAIALALLTATLIVGVIGIYIGNVNAKEGQQQVDCIFKDLSIPTVGTQHKYIASIASKCDVKIID